MRNSIQGGGVRESKDTARAIKSHACYSVKHVYSYLYELRPYFNASIFFCQHLIDITILCERVLTCRKRPLASASGGGHKRPFIACHG